MSSREVVGCPPRPCAAGERRRERHRPRVDRRGPRRRRPRRQGRRRECGARPAARRAVLGEGEHRRRGRPDHQRRADFAEAIAPSDAPTVERMRGSAGAIPFARTNLPDFGLRVHTDSSLHGLTRNPWNPHVTAGGSSGGEASAIATGMSPIGLGNDIGGSLRNPAHCCGIASMKPTPGVVPMASVNPPEDKLLSSQLMLVEGPMARRVADVRAGLRDPRRTAPRATPRSVTAVLTDADPARAGSPIAVAARSTGRPDRRRVDASIRAVADRPVRCRPHRRRDRPPRVRTDRRPLDEDPRRRHAAPARGAALVMGRDGRRSSPLRRRRSKPTEFPSLDRAHTPIATDHAAVVASSSSNIRSCWLRRGHCRRSTTVPTSQPPTSNPALQTMRPVHATPTCSACRRRSPRRNRRRAAGRDPGDG